MEELINIRNIVGIIATSIGIMTAVYQYVDKNEVKAHAGESHHSMVEVIRYFEEKCE